MQKSTSGRLAEGCVNLRHAETLNDPVAALDNFKANHLKKYYSGTPDY